jgi:ABC-type spermidine/putrescine transport system permease subunit II
VTPFQRGISAVLGWLSRIFVGIVIVLMLVPVAVVTVLSFSNETFLQFPPHHWGFRQYSAFFGSPYWVDAVKKSFEIGIPVALLATAIGIPAVLALNRTNLPFRGALQSMGLAPLVIPGVAYAMAMYTFYAQIHLLGKSIGLIMAHTILALPFIVIITGAAISRIPRELELVAMTLGASRFRAVTGITLRLLWPAIAASFIFAFLTSFDEAVFVNFVGGPGLITLPKAIYDSVLTGIDPLITAIATVLMAGTGIIMMLAVYWRSESAV